MDLALLLPDSLEGWKSEKIVTLSNPTDMYKYMDGGAELYISYGFKEALSYTYVTEGQPEVLAEIYDLLEPRNAFGVFTQTREEESSEYGQGTYAIPGALFFWKGRYYISLSSWESSPGSNEFLNKLASYIDEKITETGDIPDLIKLLPEEERISAGFKFFHHYVWLNSFFFISDQNLLNIDNTTDAVIARYMEGDNRKYLLLVQYPDPKSARQAYTAFGKEFFPEGLTGNCIRLEDGTFLAASLKGSLVSVVFNASGKQSANQLLVRVLDRYSIN